MKIYTLFATGEWPEAIKSWKEMNPQVVNEIKDIIRKREAPEEEDEEEEDFIEENFCIASDLESTAKQWTEDSHLAQLIWTDECDEFWITSSEL